MKTSYWWCPHCKEEVDGSRVTYQELHDTCGYPVETREIESAIHDLVSIRDYFAGQALTALIEVYVNTGKETPADDYLAHWAYQKADAMLAAREENNVTEKA